MKLKNELKKVTKVFEDKKEIIENHARELKEIGGYKNLEIRLGFDVLKAFMGTSYICSLYDDYNCDDSHITTLVKKALKDAKIKY